MGYLTVRLSFQILFQISEQKKLLSSKETESAEVSLRLRFSEDKLQTYEAHIQHLNGRVAQLEDELQRAAAEKKDILADLRKKEAEIDDLSLKVVQGRKELNLWPKWKSFVVGRSYRHVRQDIWFGWFPFSLGFALKQ